MFLDSPGPDGPIAQFRLERTPDKREVDGSSPSRPTIGGVAQLGEHLPCKQGVIGSIPFTSTRWCERMCLEAWRDVAKFAVSRRASRGARACSLIVT